MSANQPEPGQPEQNPQPEQYPRPEQYPQQPRPEQQQVPEQQQGPYPQQSWPYPQGSEPYQQQPGPYQQPHESYPQQALPYQQPGYPGAPPGQYPSYQAPPPAGGHIWLGILLAIGIPLLGALLPWALESLLTDPPYEMLFLLPIIGFVLAIILAIVLTCIRGTRRTGIGMWIGIACLPVIAFGTCVAILFSY